MTTSSRTPARIKALLGLRTDQLSTRELLELMHWHYQQAALLSDEFLYKFPTYNDNSN